MLSKISPTEQIIRAPARICLNTITIASHFQEKSEKLPLRFFVKELYKNAQVNEENEKSLDKKGKEEIDLREDLLKREEKKPKQDKNNNSIKKKW